MRIFRTVCCSMRFKNDLVEAGGARARARTAYISSERGRLSLKQAFHVIFARGNTGVVAASPSSISFPSLSSELSRSLSLSLSFSLSRSLSLPPLRYDPATTTLPISSSWGHLSLRLLSGPTTVRTGRSFLRFCFFHSFIFPPASIAMSNERLGTGRSTHTAY